MNNLKLYWFLVDFHMGILLVYLPILLRSYTNMSEANIGTYFFLGGIVAIVGAIISGFLAHKINDETNVLRYGSITLVLGLLCLVVSSNPFFLIMSIILIFFLRSAIYAIGDEVSITYLNKTGSDFGKVRSFGSIGWGVNFVINGILVVYAPKLLLLEWIIISIIFVYVAFKLPSTTSVKKHNNTNWLILFKNKNYVFFLIASGIMWGCITNVQIYSQFMIQDMGGSIAVYGLISAIAAILDFFIMQKSSSILEKMGSYKYSIFIVFVILIKFIIIATANNYYVIYFSIIFDPIFFGLIIPFSSQYIKKMVDKDVSAIAITFVTTLNLLLGSIFSMIFGYTYEFISPNSVFILMSFFTIISLILITRVKNVES